MNDSLQIRFLFLPEGEDPDTLIRKESKNAFEDRLTSALSLSDFFFQTLSKQSNVQTLEGRARFATLALKHIQQLPAGLFQGIILEELSKRARIDIQELKQQIKRPEEAPLTTPIAPASSEAVLEFKNKLPPPVQLAMTLLIQYPHLVSLITEPLPKSDLPGYTFMIQLIEIIKKNTHITTGALLENWRGKKEEASIAKLAHIEHMIPEAGIESEFLGTLRQLITLGIDAEINGLLAKAAQGGFPDNQKLALSALIAKKKALMK
jgi:DNA primase